MYETPITSELVEFHGIDSHIWQLGVLIPFEPALFPSIIDFDNDGLKLAVFMSLFSDCRFTFESGGPPVLNDRRGWWGDDLLREPGDSDGSLLWTLLREKIIVPDILNQASDIITEALQWLIDDRVAEKVDISVSRAGLYRLSMIISVKRPENFESTRYHFVWDNLEDTIELVSETIEIPTISSRIIRAAPSVQGTPINEVNADATPIIDMLEVEDDGLEMAVFISLFTDARFEEANGEPPIPDDRRGWWGDELLENLDDSDGSLLWTLLREKIIEPDIINIITDYVQGSLQWLIDDGVAEKIDIFVERRGTYTLGIQVNIFRINDFESTRFYFVWDNLINLIQDVS